MLGFSYESDGYATKKDHKLSYLLRLCYQFFVVFFALEPNAEQLRY